MGLQLVLVDVEKEADPVAALRRVAATGSGLDTLFADVILPRLDPDDVAFLGVDPGPDIDEAWWEEMLVAWFGAPEEEEAPESAEEDAPSETAAESNPART
jgi:hypothetical protein